MPILSDFESEEEVYHDISSGTSSWNSDVSIGDIFESLSMYMVSTSHLEDDGEDSFEFEDLIQSHSDSWIKHLKTLRDMRFEQYEPPTEGKVT